MRRLQAVWGQLTAEQRLAAGAAVAVVASTLLPWFSITFDDGRVDGASAFRVFSWIEAAIFLVALAVLALLWARSERKAFHLPGGDGTVVLAAGLWVLLLLFWRTFDRPDPAGSALVGVEWGLLVAVLAGGALAAAGLRLRAAGQPEPPLPPDRPRSRPSPAADRTRVVPPDEARTTVAPPRPRPPAGERWPARPPQDPGDEPEQLSFDDRP